MSSKEWQLLRSRSCIFTIHDYSCFTFDAYNILIWTSVVKLSKISSIKKWFNHWQTRVFELEHPTCSVFVLHESTLCFMVAGGSNLWKCMETWQLYCALFKTPVGLLNPTGEYRYMSWEDATRKSDRNRCPFSFESSYVSAEQFSETGAAGNCRNISFSWLSFCNKCQKCYVSWAPRHLCRTECQLFWDFRDLS